MKKNNFSVEKLLRFAIIYWFVFYLMFGMLVNSSLALPCQHPSIEIEPVKEKRKMEEENNTFDDMDCKFIKGLEDYSKRTLQEFVEDLVTNGRTLEQILIVAFCTRWKDSIKEIRKLHRKLKYKVL